MEEILVGNIMHGGLLNKHCDYSTVGGDASPLTASLVPALSFEIAVIDKEISVSKLGARSNGKGVSAMQQCCGIIILAARSNEKGVSVV